MSFQSVLIPGDEVSFIAYDARTPLIPNFVPGTVPIPDSAPRIIVRASPRSVDFCSANPDNPYCQLFRVTNCLLYTSPSPRD